MMRTPIRLRFFSLLLGTLACAFRLKKRSRSVTAPFEPDLTISKRYTKAGQVDPDIIAEELAECRSDRVGETTDPVDDAIHEVDSTHKVHTFGEYMGKRLILGDQGPFKFETRKDKTEVYKFLNEGWNAGNHQYFKWVWQVGEDGMCDPDDPNIWIVWRGCKHTVAAMAPYGTRDALKVCGAGSGKLHSSPHRNLKYLCINDKSGHYKPDIHALRSIGLEDAWRVAMSRLHLDVDEIILREKNAGGTATNGTFDHLNVSLSDVKKGLSGACFLDKSTEAIVLEEKEWNLNMDKALQTEYDFISRNVLDSGSDD